MGRPPGTRSNYCRRGHRVADPTIGIWLPGGEGRYCRLCQQMQNKREREERTHCGRGHDLTLPGAVKVTNYSGHRRNNCVECLRLKRERRAAEKSETHPCEVCKKVFTGRKGRRTCSDKCRREMLRNLHLANPQAPRAPYNEAAHAANLLRLYEELDRETRAWMRPAIEARIREAMKGR